jgi:dTDP-glucose 4,6-dehydratase
LAVLITGAAGFIGCNLVRHLLERWPDRKLVSFDLLTYAGRLSNLQDVAAHTSHTFVQGDIADRDAVAAVFHDHDIDGVIHLAAESHVDRSIDDPLAFVRTNVVGTAVLLQEARRAWGERQDVRFLQVSTDEVFGSLGDGGRFDAKSPYDPSSPYSASKAASDHLVRAWRTTYGFSVVIVHPTNNFGPYQQAEKLVPRAISRALLGRPVPLYGDGTNVREWLWVGDHCDALGLAYERGEAGRNYAIGAGWELTNLELAGRLLDLLDDVRGIDPGTSRSLIEFVDDRPGHDYRYAVDSSPIRDELGWRPQLSLDEGLERTVRWYLDHPEWLEEGSGST